MSNDSSFDDAKRLYLEQYGDPMVPNTYLKIALVLLTEFGIRICAQIHSTVASGDFGDEVQLRLWA